MFLKGLDKKMIASMEGNIGDDITKREMSYKFLTPSTPITLKKYLEETNSNMAEKLKGAVDRDVFIKIMNILNIRHI